MSIISIKNIYKAYEKGVYVLNGVSLEIEEGDFVAVKGESGSGKSTLLHSMSGATSVTAGEVIFDGVNLDTIKNKDIAELRRRKMGFVYQFHYLADNLNVIDNILMPLSFDGKRVDKDLAYSLLERLNLTHIAKKHPKELSGGECQRVALLRAISFKPKVIFADEPTGSLDLKNSHMVMELLKEFNEKDKTTIVLATHSDICARYAKKRIIVSDGKIVCEEADL